MSFTRFSWGLLATAVAAAAVAAPVPEKLRIMGPVEREAGFSTTARAVQEAMTASGAARSVEVYYVEAFMANIASKKVAERITSP